MGNDANVSKRDGFRSRGGFIIACIGSAVGMGNIWRFPTLVSKWGGMTFLLPYFLFVILIGSTGVIGEFALGRAAGAGPVDAFGMCTEARWGKRRPGELVGYIPVLGSLALAIGYTCVMGWIFKYTFLAFDGGLSAMGQDMDGIVATFNATASAWGANVWVVVAVAVSFVIMSFGIAGGIEKANKIMMPILFLLFVGLGIYVATLPGASDGYRYIFTIKPAGLLDPYVWIYAFGQAFFSLSVAGNGSVIYGSYLSKSECIPSSARNVALFDTIAALLAAFVIIPAMAAGGAQLDAGGPGLMFIYLVHVMNGMAGGRIVAMVFFVCVAFAGVTSIINLVRGAGRVPAGAARPQARAGHGGDPCDRPRRCAVHSGHRVAVDGRRVHLHLPAGRAACGGHVLLDRRQEARARERQPRRAQAHRRLVLSAVQVCLLRERARGARRRRGARRHRLKRISNKNERPFAFAKGRCALRGLEHFDVCIAVRADGDVLDAAADGSLQIVHVVERLLRQVADRAAAGDVAVEAGQILIDGLCLGQLHADGEAGRRAHRRCS